MGETPIFCLIVIFKTGLKLKVDWISLERKSWKFGGCNVACCERWSIVGGDFFSIIIPDTQNVSFLMNIK